MPNFFQTGDGSDPTVIYFVVKGVMPVWFRRAFVQALNMMCNPNNWTIQGDATIDFARDKSVEMLDSLVIGINPFPVGMVEDYAGDTAPDGWLLCDGSNYLITDYQDLYDVIGNKFNVVAPIGTFNVPDLRGRVAVGAGSGSGLTTHAVGDDFGQESVELDVSEMPSHSHTDSGHVHTEVIAVATLINGGLEAPASAAFPAASSTGAGFANLTNTGGGFPHTNMQPSLALNKIIFTGKAP